MGALEYAGINNLGCFFKKNSHEAWPEHIFFGKGIRFHVSRDVRWMDERELKRFRGNVGESASVAFCVGRVM